MSNGFVFLVYTYSPLHAGIGQTMGMVDLPIEREKHTGYPCVYATGLKGSLRAYWKKNNFGQLDTIFGKDDASAGAGGAVFTDLKILLFPVRASEGTFKWVTCPRVLKRFYNDYKIALGSEPPQIKLQKLDGLESVPHQLDPQQHLLLEDFIFQKTGNSNQNNDKKFLINNMDVPLKDVFLVDDEYFDHFVQYATQVIARNKLKNNKTSDNLWYEEALPADTILYSFVKPSIVGNEDQLNQFDTNLDNKILQIGGGETVGYGIVKLYILNKKEEQSNGGK